MPDIGSSQFSTRLSTAGFKPVFFQPEWEQPHHSGDASKQSAGASPGAASCDARSSSAPHPSAPEKPTRVSYHEPRDGTHERFCLSENFALLKQQFRENLDVLVQFCRDNGVSDADKIADRFDIFFKRRFDQASYAQHGHGYAPLIDSRGKQALDNFCDIIRDPNVPLSKKIPAIRNLSEGVAACGPGAVSVLTTADINLSRSVGGIKAALWKAKEDTIRAILLREVRAKFVRTHGALEIHRVNHVWNYLAGPMGLHKDPDTSGPAIETAFLERCLEIVCAELTPDRLASTLADECLSIFNSVFVADNVAQHGSCTAKVYDRLLNALQAVLDTLQLDENALCLHSFVFLSPGGEVYRLRSDSSLVARDILGIMKDNQLLVGEPQNWGAWQAENTGQYALFTFGESIAWRAERQNATSRWPGLDKSSDVETVSVADLAAWQRHREHDSGAPPIAAMWHPLHRSESKDVVDLPTEYLLPALRTNLDRLSGENLEKWLESNLLDVLGKLPQSDRARFFDEAIGTNMAENDADIIDIILGISDEERHPENRAKAQACPIFHSGAPFDRLHNAMKTGDAQAIAIWHRLVVGTALFDKAQPHLLELLDTPQPGTTNGLELATLGGHCDVIDAYRFLLTDPLIVPCIKDNLRPLLAGTLPPRAPVLLSALDAGNAAVVHALHTLWAAPAFQPHIRKVLPALITAQNQVIKSVGLGLALEHGHAAAITALHALLKDPNILPHISHLLPSLLSARRGDGSPGLYLALQNGHAAAITALHALLKDPDILPHLSRALPELLRARRRDGTPGLCMALLNGRAAAITAFHALVKDPDILPYVSHILPQLLGARRNDGWPGFHLALWYDYKATITAFFTLLVDPDVLPIIRDELPRLLAGKRPHGASYLSRVIGRSCNAGVVRTIHRTLIHPEIAPYLTGILAQLLPPKDLLFILQNGNPEIIAAFHALLVDPGIKPHVEKIMPDVVRIRLSPDKNGLVELAQALQNGEATAILKFPPFTKDAWYYRIFRKTP